MKRSAVLALGMLPFLLAAGDWPQFLGPTRDGQSAETGLLDAWPARGPTEVWRHPVGEGYASPIVADGKCLVFHRVGNEEVLDALNASTGKPVWKYAYRTDYEDSYGRGNGPRSTPVAAGGRVFTLGPAGNLHAVDLKTGKKLWSVDLHTTYRVPANFFGVGTTGLAEGDRLVINVGGEEAGVVALDCATGKEVWKSTSQQASYSSPVAGTLAGQRLIVFFTREGLLAVEAATGKVRYTHRWRSRNSASVNAATPLLLPDDQVFLTSSYNTGATLLRLEKGGVKEVWKSDRVLSSHFGTPVVVGETMYGFDGRQEEGARLRAIDWKSGKVLWSEPDLGCGSIVAAGKKLFILSEAGELILAVADPTRFKAVSRAQVLDRPCRANLALANGLLYARDGSKLVCWKVSK